MSDEERDQDLGRLLNEIPTPDYDPGFFANLEATLAAETREQQPFVVRHWFTAGLTTVAAAAMAGIVTINSLPTDTFEAAQSVAPASTTTSMAAPVLSLAAETSQKMVDTLDNANALSGRLNAEYFDLDGNPAGDGGGATWFVAAANGSYRLKTDGAGEYPAYDAAYNADSGEFQTSSGFTSEIRPDESSYSIDSFLATARAVQRAANADARVDTFEGQDVVIIDAQVNDFEEEWSPNRVEVIVDRTTNVPLRVTSFRDDTLRSRTTLSNFALNPAVSARDFMLPLADGTSLRTVDPVWREVSVESIAPQLSYTPRYASLPERFELVDVWYSEAPYPGGLTGAEVLRMVYRDGFETVTVQLSAANGPDAYFGDVLTNPYTVRGGAFDGLEARISADLSIPFVQVSGATLSVDISGALSPAELRQAVVMSDTPR